MPPVRIVIADDHPVYRDGLRHELGRKFDIVGEAADAKDAVRIIRETKPDVVACDLDMPGGGGIAVAAAVGDVSHVVILTVHENERNVLDAISAGALGYLLKTASSEELREAFTIAAKGEPVFSPKLAGLVLGEFRRLAKRAGLTPLTDREREVLLLVAQGMNYKQIAGELVISARTAENHVRNILGKLHLSRRDELVRYAVDHGLR